MAGGFEIINHTADVGIRVWGKEWREVFHSAAEGMLSIIVDLNTVVEREEREIRVEGENGEELLLRWLREILFLMEEGGMVFSKIEVKKDNFSHKNLYKYFIYAVLKGEKIDLSRHDICTEIKAVTRHGFFMKRNGLLWEAKILFDV